MKLNMPMAKATNKSTDRTKKPVQLPFVNAMGAVKGRIAEYREEKRKEGKK